MGSDNIKPEEITTARFNWLRRLLSPSTGFKRARLVFLSTLIFALAAHLFCWMNPLFSHDSLLIVQADGNFQTAIGRPFQQCYVLCRGAIVSPWLVGMLGTLYMALANSLVVEMLDIRSRVFSIGTAALTATSITVTLANATYIHCYDIFMLSYLCATVAVFSCARLRKTGMPIAAILVCVSLGLYQSYLQVFFTLALLVCLRNLIEKNLRESVSLAFKEIAVGILGCALYFLAAKAALALTNIPISEDYNSLSAAFSAFESPLSSVMATWNTYTEPFRYLLSPETHAVSLCGAANLVFMISIVAALILLVRAYRLNVGSIALVLLCVLLAPLAMGCVNLASYGVLHEIMIFSYFLIYPFAFMCADLLGSKNNTGSLPQAQTKALPIVDIWKTVLAALMIMIALSNIIYANQVYLKKELEYEATASFVTRIIDRMEQIEGYTPGKTPVCLIGSPNDSPLVKERGGFEDVTGMGLESNVAITYISTIESYFDHVLGYPLTLCDKDKANALAGSEEVRKMPVFPQNGSIAFVDDVLVVKLAEEHGEAEDDM